MLSLYYNYEANFGTSNSPTKGAKAFARAVNHHDFKKLLAAVNIMKGGNTLPKIKRLLSSGKLDEDAQNNSIIKLPFLKEFYREYHLNEGL